MKTQSFVRILATLILAIAGGAPAKVLGAYILQGFSPTNYLGGSPSSLATMRTNLGIDGLAVEDFRHFTNTHGRLKFSGAGVVGIVPENGNSWGATNTGFLNVSTTPSNSATIEIEGGTPILGIGFSAFESGAFESGIVAVLTSIKINGVSEFPLTSNSLPSFTFSNTIRNGYLVIRVGAGDPLIQRVDFLQSGPLDGYQFDYIAFVSSCPPSSIRSIGVSEVAICWPSISNAIYQLDYRSDFTTNNWVPLFTNILAIGLETCVADSVGRGIPQRFYRLVCPTTAE